LNHFVSVGKDVFYKVRNSSYFNWRQMLLKNALDSLNGIEVEDSTQANLQPCFIIDDSDLPKRGKTMELIGKIFSHVSRQYHLGYKCLNLAFWSGKHLVHVDFSLHIENTQKGNQGMTKQDLAKRYGVKRSVKSYGHLRIKEAVIKKTDSAIKMMRR